MYNNHNMPSFIVKRIDTVSSVIGKISSYVLLITIAATVIEVAARYLFNAPTVWSYEVEMFTCGGLYVLVGAYCQLHKTHVSVDVFYQMWSKQVQRYMRMLVYFPLILIFSVAITYMGAEYALTSVKMAERSYTSWGPVVWPVKLLLPIGSFFLVLQAISDFLRDLFQLEGAGK